MCDHPLSRMIARRLLGCHTLLCLVVSLLQLDTTSPALPVDRRSFAYVANSRSNSVSIYIMHPTHRGLTPLTTAETGADPAAIMVNPNGRFAYVTERQGGASPSTTSHTL